MTTNQLTLAIRALSQHGESGVHTWCRECKGPSADTCAWEGHTLANRCDVEHGWWAQHYRLEVAAENIATRAERRR